MQPGKKADVAAPDEAIITLPDGSIILGTHATSQSNAGAGMAAPQPAGPATMGSMPKITCYACHTQMAYPAGSPVVRCPVCQTLNGTQTVPPVIFTCPYCRCTQQVPGGSPMATCGGCRRLVKLVYAQSAPHA